MKGKNLLIPLVSFIEPANVYEGNLLNPMIQNVQKELSLHIDIVVGDMGYISSDHNTGLSHFSGLRLIGFQQFEIEQSHFLNDIPKQFIILHVLLSFPSHLFPKIHGFRLSVNVD